MAEKPTPQPDEDQRRRIETLAETGQMTYLDATDSVMGHVAERSDGEAEVVALPTARRLRGRTAMFADIAQARQRHAQPENLPAHPVSGSEFMASKIAEHGSLEAALDAEPHLRLLASSIGRSSLDGDDHPRDAA